MIFGLKFNFTSAEATADSDEYISYDFFNLNYRSLRRSYAFKEANFIALVQRNDKLAPLRWVELACQIILKVLIESSCRICIQCLKRDVKRQGIQGNCQT